MVEGRSKRAFQQWLADHEELLVNASRVRNVPGRKSAVSDAAWLADLVVPPPPIRALRGQTQRSAHSQIARPATVIKVR